MGYKTETHKHRQPEFPEERGVGAAKYKLGKYMVAEEDLTLSGGHTNEICRSCITEMHV